MSERKISRRLINQGIASLPLLLLNENVSNSETKKLTAMLKLVLEEERKRTTTNKACSRRLQPPPPFIGIMDNTSEGGASFSEPFANDEINYKSSIIPRIEWFIPEESEIGVLKSDTKKIGATLPNDTFIQFDPIAAEEMKYLHDILAVYGRNDLPVFLNLLDKVYIQSHSPDTDKIIPIDPDKFLGVVTTKLNTTGSFIPTVDPAFLPELLDPVLRYWFSHLAFHAPERVAYREPSKKSAQRNKLDIAFPADMMHQSVVQTFVVATGKKSDTDADTFRVIRPSIEETCESKGKYNFLAQQCQIDLRGTSNVEPGQIYYTDAIVQINDLYFDEVIDEPEIRGAQYRIGTPVMRMQGQAYELTPLFIEDFHSTGLYYSGTNIIHLTTA